MKPVHACNHRAILAQDGGVFQSLPRQLPAAVYWIGDLSYVINNFFDQGLYRLEGVHVTKAGHPFAIYATAHGDGIFVDNEGDDYGVDVANLGCIPLDAIDQASDLGHLVRFHSPFVCRWIEEGGFICFGDLAIKTDTLSDADYPDATSLQQEPGDGSSFKMAADEQKCSNASHAKLDSYDLVDLILRDEDEADSDTQLVMRDIAYYIVDPDCSELLGYAGSSDKDRQYLIQAFHLVFHSGLEEFTEYFRGYYGTPDNETHAINLEAGRTKMELYAFLKALDWPKIYELCRRHSDVASVARLFNAWTGFDYTEERARYPVEAWDGTPRWPMQNGKYLASS